MTYHWFKTIFASGGDKTAVPSTDPSGYVAYDVGYPFDYQRVLGTDPQAKPIERDKLNQLLYDATSVLHQYQVDSAPEYIDATANGGTAYAYEIGAIVIFTDGKYYENTIAGNTAAPNVSGWIERGSVSTATHNIASDADYTLSASENKHLRIIITDTGVLLTTARNIIVDNSQKRFIAVNNTLQTLTFKTSAGTGIAVSAGQTADLLCDGTNVIYAISSPVTQQATGVRQTVQVSAVDTSGFPTFISIGTGLSVNIAATTVNVVIQAAGGKTSLDRLGTISADTTISSLTASSTLYLYADIASGGAVTLGFTNLAPVYQFGGTPSVTSGQFTFNISEMTAYVGNGATADKVWRVFIGEAVTNATNVTSVINYALNGIYESQFVATIPNTLVSLNHNIGVYPARTFHIMENTTTDLGWAVGDTLINASCYGNASFAPITPFATKYVVGLTARSNTPYIAPKSSAGVVANLTAASWKYKLRAERGF